MSTDSLLAKYEAEVERLGALKQKLGVEESRLRWAPLAGFVVGLVVGVLVKPIYGLLAFALGLSMLGTGLYLTRVHRMERDYNLARAKKEVRRLRAEKNAREASPPASSSAGSPASPGGDAS